MKDLLQKLSFGFYALSAVLTGVGFRVMYNYGDYDEKLSLGDKTGHIVGGDAYNYIIIAVRGAGYLVAALTAAVVASALLLYTSKRQEPAQV